MRRRSKMRDKGDDAEVAMSPLIDCVFLLLIFFLVTTMLKRKEKQIPVKMPNSTASVAADTRENQLLIGLTAEGTILCPKGKDKDGSIIWKPVDSLASYLTAYQAEKGVGALAIPIQINAHRDVAFQDAINALDVCKLQGFGNVSVKTRQLAGWER